MITYRRGEILHTRNSSPTLVVKYKLGRGFSSSAFQQSTLAGWTTNPKDRDGKDGGCNKAQTEACAQNGEKMPVDEMRNLCGSEYR